MHENLDCYVNIRIDKPKEVKIRTEEPVKWLSEVYARENGHGWTGRSKYSSHPEAGNC